jgi:hypothetical protein
MILAASTWAAYVILFAALALLSHRAIAAAVFALAVFASLPAAVLPLGNCAPWLPAAGSYTVLGARIDVPDAYSAGAIYAMLDDGNGEPQCYRLPYSTSQANALQGAMDGEGGVGAKVDGEGGVAYEGEPPVTADSAKQADRPQFQLGG